MADDRVRNGVFVNSKGRVYAIVNGSPNELDVKNSPLAKLPPGHYTEAQVKAALKKLNANE